MTGDFKTTSVKLAISGIISIAALAVGVSGNITDQLRVKTSTGETIDRPAFVGVQPGDKLQGKSAIGKGGLMIVSLLIASGVGGYCSLLAFKAAREYELYQAEAEVEVEERRLMREVEAEARITATKVLAEVKSEEELVQQLDRMGIAVNQPALQQSTLTQPKFAALPPQETTVQQNTGSIPAPTLPVNQVQGQIAATPQPVQSQPVTQNTGLPDGAILVEPSALNNIDRYPVIMTVAQQGAGKSVTMASIFEYLDGVKVLSTPKIQDHTNPNLRAVYDLAFGFNPITNQGAWFGRFSHLEASDDRDLSWHLKHSRDSGASILDFVWAAGRESVNRQTKGMKPDDRQWRVFFDEASYTYTTGYMDALDDGKDETKAKKIIEVTNKSSIQNFRGQKIQMFFGAHSRTIEAIGVKGFAKAIDEVWFLHPGLNAISAANQFGKVQLANWLKRRVNEGYGIALLEKKGLEFQVVNLPQLSYLKKFDPPAPQAG
jgi:hypothetical protein